MKLKIIGFLFFSAFLLMLNSCVDDTSTIIAKWKIQNDEFFVNMKDSLDYKKYNFPIERGGSAFYYKIVNVGDENSLSPLLTSKVKVNYKGKLITGEVFDGTYGGTSPLNNTTARPYEFYNNQLIPGWTENLMQMKVGEIRTIVLPSELAYGSSFVGTIKPFSTLIFDIQLISYTN